MSATVTTTSNADKLAAARSQTGRGCGELTFPALGLWIHSNATGTDRYIAAGEGVELLKRSVAGHVLDCADEHEMEMLIVAAGATQRGVEVLGLDAFRALFKPVAQAGIDVVLDTSTVSRPTDPPPPVPLPKLGTSIEGPFRRGHVVEVGPQEHEAVTIAVAALGRDVTLLSFAGPDRILAQRHGSSQYQTWRTTGIRSQTATDWLRDICLSFEPRLIVLEQEAAERGVLDPAAIARAHRVAVALLIQAKES